MANLISKLEAERSALLHDLATTGDMRRGSLTECYRNCGKPTCACAAPDHPGHGPYYAFTRKVNGTTKTQQLRPGPLLTKIDREVETYRAFRAACEQLLALNAVICDARLVEPVGEKKKRHSGPSSRPRSPARSKRS